MGFFDFVRDAGQQIFKTDAAAAASIQEHLEVKTSGIRNIEVTFDDGVATLCGDCVNQATKDSAVLMIGNLKGVEKVVADELRVDPPTAGDARAAPAGAATAGSPTASPEFYTVVKGDTLGAIAKRYYGKASAYTRIFEANKDLIDDPDRIFPGQKIRIPRD